VEHIVFIVDPTNEVCRGIADAVADSDADIRPVASAEDLLHDAVSDARGCVIAPSDLAGMGIRAMIVALRMRYPRLAVIVLGHDDLPKAVELMRAGATEYLEAPISPRLLRTAVRQAIGEGTKP
jgi:FixJ family two-component response regulator